MPWFWQLFSIWFLFSITINCAVWFSVKVNKPFANPTLHSHQHYQRKCVNSIPGETYTKSQPSHHNHLSIEVEYFDAAPEEMVVKSKCQRRQVIKPHPNRNVQWWCALPCRTAAASSSHHYQNQPIHPAQGRQHLGKLLLHRPPVHETRLPCRVSIKCQSMSFRLAFAVRFW